MFKGVNMLLVETMTRRVLRLVKRLARISINLLTGRTIVYQTRRVFSYIKARIRMYAYKYLFLDFRQATNCENDIVKIQGMLNEPSVIKGRHPGVVQFLSGLFAYAKSSINELPDFINTSNKQIYIMHLTVWGDPYVDKMLKYLVPSLLAQDNIPSIADKYEVYFWVHCDKSSYNKIISANIISELGRYTKIKYDVIPDSIYDGLTSIYSSYKVRIVQRILGQRTEYKYYMLGTVQNIAMLTAKKNRALFSFFMPDFLFSDKSIVNMSNLIDQGHKAILAGAFRSSTEGIASKVLNRSKNNILAISGHDLSDIVAKTMHKAAQVRIVSNQNRNLNLCPQFIFTYENEIVVRALHSHPLLVDFAKINIDIDFDYLPIDNELLLKIVDRSEPFSSQLYVVENPEEISFMEISDQDVEVIIKRKYTKGIHEHVKEYITLGGWSDVNFYLLSKRCRYRSSPSAEVLLSDISDQKLIDPLLVNFA